jgi:hypothetical protein
VGSPSSDPCGFPKPYFPRAVARWHGATGKRVFEDGPDGGSLIVVFVLFAAAGRCADSWLSSFGVYNSLKLPDLEKQMDSEAQRNQKTSSPKQGVSSGVPISGFPAVFRAPIDPTVFPPFSTSTRSQSKNTITPKPSKYVSIARRVPSLTLAAAHDRMHRTFTTNNK